MATILRHLKHDNFSMKLSSFRCYCYQRVFNNYKDRYIAEITVISILWFWYIKIKYHLFVIRKNCLLFWKSFLSLLPYTFVKLIISHRHCIAIRHKKVIIRLLIGNSKKRKTSFCCSDRFWPCMKTIAFHYDLHTKR